MRFVFVTNPYDEESHVVLQAALAAGHEPVLLLTPRQRRKGAGPLQTARKLAASHGYPSLARGAIGLLTRRLRARWRRVNRPPASAEEVAAARGIPVLAPARAAEPAVLERVGALSPDLLVSCYCTQRLPAPLLAAARRGAVNVHRSLLPEYAGPRPVFWALYFGAPETGVTIHRMTEKIDAGEILAQIARPCLGHTEASLKRELTLAAAALLPAVLARLENGLPFPGKAANRPSSYLGRPTRRQLAELRRRERVGRKECPRDRSGT